MHSTFAALCLLSCFCVCFVAKIPFPEKVPKFSLSNIRGAPNIRGQPAKGPFENPVFDHPPFFDNEDEMFEERPPLSPAEGINPDDYVLPDEDFVKPAMPDLKSNEFDYEEHDKRIDERPVENPELLDENAHENDKAPPTEDKEIHVEIDDSEKNMPEDEEEAPKVEPENDLDEDVPPRTGALPLGSPFFDIDQMRRYFELVERAMDKVFRQTIEEAQVLNGTFTNTTEEEVDVDGHKYKVVKSIIKSGDHNSTIFIEAVETTLESNRTKRSNWYSEGAQTADDLDP